MSEKTLKHVSTGKCLHTSGGWPGNGRTLVLWSGCEAERLQIWFVKQGNNRIIITIIIIMVITVTGTIMILIMIITASRARRNNWKK